ncbi:Zinc finger BED domain-containing protein 4 [Eumeta japonica]|uniref:Zinc finger BED domain-containing protein 4 n=1 Tax=Eumeta variegata TaxID=151549 RepID=A0A4C1SVJ7_EUMVA|nr:Zinc finger BED domain-containing protein 4 [Eumeta japonica]
MVSRFHITEKVIPEMYQRVRAKILELLKDLPHIVITTDIWTSDFSSQSNDFISLTAHGITATFEYKSYCLEVLPFDGSHTGINIASNLKAFHDWNIQDRVRAIVSDNAANAFKDDKVKEMITKARSIIGHFSHSTSSNKVLKEMQDTYNIANHVLIQDISTRWDSTLQALRRLLEQRVAVQACLPRITYKAELTTEEWIMMEKVVNILRYFEEATKSISKSTATLSYAIPLINSLRKLLENMRGSSPREEENISQKLAGDLLMALNERFEDLENEEIYCLATTLDPRYKTRIFQLHSTTSTAKKRLVELIINFNEDLYSENASDMVAPTPSTSSEMNASGGLWSVCENIIRESEEDDPLSTLSSNNSLKEEVEKYLRSPNIPRDADPLLFWQNDVLYPHLKKLAQYFSFQMSSVASERLFSTAVNTNLLWCAYKLHMELCLNGEDQSETENRGGRYGTATNRCSERMWRSCVENAKCMATLSRLKCMQLICAGGCAINKLQRNRCIRRSCTPTATYEARLK